MKITIVGLPGSGKSTLAKRIAGKLHLPLIHIDHLWLEGGGGYDSRSTPNPERTHAFVRAKIMEAIQSESWVSDGFYPKIQPKIAERADLIIFLDAPLWRRLLNHTKRIFNRAERYEEVTFWEDLAFFFEMIGRDSTKSSKVNSVLEPYQSKIVILKSKREVEYFLNKLQFSYTQQV